MVSNTQTADPYQLVQLPTQLWDIGDVKPYERNTKVHSKEHIEKLKKSIRERGLFDALIVDMDGVIIAGHGRFQALTELGHVKVPVKHAAHLTKDQADAARIAHNKTASTEYDSDFMAQEIRRLSQSTEINLDELGLDDGELDFLVEDLGSMNIDAISTDLDSDIDAQEEETAEKVAATDASSEKVTKVFGFNSVPIAAVKHVRRFLADIEAETGLKGEEAFVEWVGAR
jgi:hypothetical protein